MEKQNIFFDIDGTLIGVSRRLRLSTLLSVQLAKMKGHHVYLCTGRAPKLIDASILGIGWDGVVASAGGYIEVNHKCIFENALDKLLVSYVFLLFTNHHVLFGVETRDAYYQTPGIMKFFQDRQRELNKKNVELARMREDRRRENARKPISELDINTQGVYKITFLSPDKNDFLSIKHYLEPYFNIVIFSKEGEPYMNGELVVKGCTKGDAVKRIVEYTGESMENTMAYGDSMNDYEMIQAVAKGIVYEHGPEPLIKEAYDFFEEPDQDGIYKHMTKVGLI